jgi:Flp pilus assembly protein TadB
MNALRTAFAELVGLFIDDGALALAVLVLVGVVAAAVRWAGLPALTGGVLLLAGCLAILAESLHRAARAKARSKIPS